MMLVLLNIDHLANLIGVPAEGVRWLFTLPGCPPSVEAGDYQLVEVHKLEEFLERLFADEHTAKTLRARIATGGDAREGE